MARHAEPHWREAFDCYVFVHRRHRHYLRGVARGDLKAVAARVEEILAGADADDARSRDPTVQDVCAAYLVALVPTHKTRTIAGHQAMLGKFCDFVGPNGRYGDLPASSIRAADLGRMRAAWAKKGHASAYQAQLYKSVLACWNWACRPEPDRVKEKLLPENHLAGMRRPSARGRSERTAERIDLARFLRFARSDLNGPWPPGTRGRCVARMAAGRPGPCRRSHAPTLQRLRDTLVLLRLIGETGCRPGELCAATWDGWEPAAGTDQRGHRWGVLSVEHKNVRHTGARRKVIVPPMLVRAIERIRQRPGHHPVYLFVHRRGRGAAQRGARVASAGEPWNTQALDRRLRQWRAGAIAAGLPVPPTFTPYSLRHAYYSKTSPILGAELAGLLGGTSGAVVRKVYLHGRSEDLIAGQAQARGKRRAK